MKTYCDTPATPARTGPWPLWVVLLISLNGAMLNGTTACGATMDFNNGSDAGWVHYQPLAAYGAPVDYSFPQLAPGDLGYRTVAAVSPQPGTLGPARGGGLLADRAYSSFSTGVDVVAWDNTHDQALGLLGRATNPGLGALNGYSLTKAAGSLDLSRITGERPTNLTHVQVAWDPAHAYRLALTGVGPQLTGAAYDLTIDPSAPIATLSATDSTYASGFPGLVVFDNSNYPGEPAHTADATFDNFSADVPEPPALAAVAGLLFLFRRRRTG